MSMMDMVTQMMGGDTTKQISRQLDQDESKTQAAIATALPMLLGALAKNSSTPDGAGALHRALARHDGSILQQPGSLAIGHHDAEGTGILGQVFGARKPVVEQAMAKTSGMDPARTAQLLAMLAPVVMGALGKMQREKGLDAGAVAGMLGREREQLQQTSPDLMGMATRMLDRDGDGSFMDDLGVLGTKMFGGR